jgi:hypothetical protein
MELQEFTTALTSLINNWDNLMDEFFDSIGPDLIDENTAQLDAGLNSNGYELPEYRSDEYAAFKGRTIPDLKLTGDFWEGFVIEQTKSNLKIWSTDSKTDKLVKKYGSDIFGLTDERLDRLIKDQIYPDFMLFLSKKTNKILPA